MMKRWVSYSHFAVVWLIGCMGWAQTLPEFEVASVKQLDQSIEPGRADLSFVGTSGKPIKISGNRVMLRGTLRAIIAAAYNVKDYQVNFEGDQVVGQFLTQVAGKDVWVTVKGHLGSKDGYATFDPTEFKVGDLNVPVSLVNDQLQKKLLEQRDRLKLPDSVSNLKVENSEVVMSK